MVEPKGIEVTSALTSACRHRRPTVPPPGTCSSVSEYSSPKLVSGKLSSMVASSLAVRTVSSRALATVPGMLGRAEERATPGSEPKGGAAERASPASGPARADAMMAGSSMRVPSDGRGEVERGWSAMVTRLRSAMTPPFYSAPPEVASHEGSDGKRVKSVGREAWCRGRR